MESKNNNIIIIIIFIALLAAAFGMWVLLDDEGDADSVTGESGVMMESGAMMEAEGTMMEEAGELDGVMMMEATEDKMEGGAMMEAVDDMLAVGTYESYSPAKLAAANNGDVVLFFHATWCPTCKAADANIKQSGVPEGLTILKLDYDTETELRKKYGVTTQHTFVQVDANGELVKKWSGSRDVESIVAETL